MAADNGGVVGEDYGLRGLGGRLYRSAEVLGVLTREGDGHRLVEVGLGNGDGGIVDRFVELGRQLGKGGGRYRQGRFGGDGCTAFGLLEAEVVEQHRGILGHHHVEVETGSPFGEGRFDGFFGPGVGGEEVGLQLVAVVFELTVARRFPIAVQFDVAAVLRSQHLVLDTQAVGGSRLEVAGNLLAQIAFVSRSFGNFQGLFTLDLVGRFYIHGDSCGTPFVEGGSKEEVGRGVFESRVG